MVLGDDDALVVGAGGDLDVDPCGSAVFACGGAGPGVVVHRVLDGGEDGAVFVTGIGVRGGWVDADVNVLCVGGSSEGDKNDENWLDQSHGWKGIRLSPLAGDFISPAAVLHMACAF